MMNELQAGILLIAEPFADDPHFGRSVIFLTDHHKEEGTVGFILNKSLKMSVKTAVKGMPDCASDIFYGGPVQTDTLHYIHDKGDLIKGSVKVMEGVYWGGDFEELRFCVNNGLIEDHNIRFFIGYSGWSGGQLEEELKEKYWILADAFPNYLFATPPKDLWKTVLEHQGDTYSVIAQMEIPHKN